MTNSQKVIAICDDSMDKLTRTKQDLEEAGYRVLAFHAFPTEAELADGNYETEIADMATGYFTDFDQFIQAIHNPREALNNPDLPDHVDMVVSDGQMAGMIQLSEEDDRAKSGVTLAERMNELKVRIPIAIYTGAGPREQTKMWHALQDIPHFSGVSSLREHVAVIDVDAIEALFDVIEKRTASYSPVAGCASEVNDADYIGMLAEAPARAID